MQISFREWLEAEEMAYLNGALDDDSDHGDVAYYEGQYESGVAQIRRDWP